MLGNYNGESTVRLFKYKGFNIGVHLEKKGKNKFYASLCKQETLFIHRNGEIYMSTKRDDKYSGYFETIPELKQRISEYVKRKK